MVTIKNYTQDDLDYVIKNFQTMTVKEIAKNLNKNPNSISNATRKLGLVKQPHKNWTDEEIQFLKDNYIEMTSEEISKKLNRTVHSINAERDVLGLIRNAAWTDNEIEFLKSNFESMEHKEIGKILGRTTQAITAKCFELDLYKKELPWEEWELDFLKKNYMEMCKSEIAEILKRTPSAIGLKASRMGFKKYPYFCNYHYFDVIDTEEKAYWLGFLTADGWINRRDDINAGVVGVELQYGDINHLRKFNKSLNGNYKITDRWRKCELSPYDKQNHFCMLRIFSITMYNSLVRIGFTNNKSFDCCIPQLKDNLYRHFIRGYFDGNGTICLSKNVIDVKFCTASNQLKTDLIKILGEYEIFMHDYSYINENNVVIYVPEATSIKNKLKLLDYMYKDSTIYLDRKYKKYLKAKAFYDNQNTEPT